MRPLRPLAALIACLALLAGAGCGGDESAGGLGGSLAYLPAETPFAVELDTDLEGDQYKSLDSILNRFPGADTIRGLLESQLSMGREGVEFRRDIRPLLGNPAVIGATDADSFLADSGGGFVAALEVSDTDALDNLIERTKPRERGEVAGATVYQDEDSFFAVDDDVVVLAGSRQQLEQALERADGDEGLSEDDFEAALEELPDDALARMYVDVRALLGQTAAARGAREIPWVGALRTLGLSVAASDSSIDVDFNLRTEGDLTEEQLPLAAGDEAAEVVQRPRELGVGLRDPGQVVAFFESALQAADPDTYGDYEQGKRVLSQQLDLDVDRDVLGQLTGNLSLSVALDGAFGARAQVEDPRAFSETVDKLARALPQLGSGLGIDDVNRRGELYEASGSTGLSFVFGMAGDAFVVGSDAARADALGGAQPAAVEGASGSLVMRADAEGIARQVLAQLAPAFGLPDQLVPIFARPFDELRGSVATSTDGMTGKFSLTLD